MQACWEIIIFEDQELARDFICSSGQGVLNDPVMDECGHSYCRKCFEYQYELNGICPISQKIIRKEDITSNLIAQKMLNAMNVSCINQNQSCIWKGTLEELKLHLLNDCKYEKVECLHEGCEDKIQRKKLEFHMGICLKQKIKCKDCNQDVLKQNIQIHKEECPKAQIDCPHDCGELILRKNLGFHIANECKNIEMDCPYDECTVRGNRKIIQTHVFSKNGYIQHQDYTSEHIKQIEKSLNKMNGYFDKQKLIIEKQEFEEKIMERGKGYFIPQMQSPNIIIDSSLKKATKISFTPPTFCILDNNISQQKIYYFKLKLTKQIGVGLCSYEVIRQVRFYFNEQDRISDCFLFKITPQYQNEIIVVKIIYDESKNTFCLFNRNNNEMTSIGLPERVNKSISPVIVFYSEGDVAEILDEEAFNNKEEDLFDNQLFNIKIDFL